MVKKFLFTKKATYTGCHVHPPSYMLASWIFITTSMDYLLVHRVLSICFTQVLVFLSCRCFCVCQDSIYLTLAFVCDLRRWLFFTGFLEMWLWRQSIVRALECPVMLMPQLASLLVALCPPFVQILLDACIDVLLPMCILLCHQHPVWP
jgi:hypothetical protein